WNTPSLLSPAVVCQATRRFPGASIAVDRLAACVGGQGAIDLRPDVLRNETDAAVAEEEVAAMWMDTAETADQVLAAAVVAAMIATADRRRSGPAVHRFVIRICPWSHLRGHSEDRAVIRMAPIGRTGGTPGLFEQGGLAGIRVGDALATLLQV